MKPCSLVLFKYFLVIFSNVNLTSAPISVGIQETVYMNKLRNVLLDITNNFFYGRFIHIVMSEEDSSLSWSWGDLLKKDLFKKWSIVITNPNKQENGNTTELPDVYIIFFNNYQKLIQLCNSLRNVSRSWNPGAKFLLITATSNISSKPKLDEFVVSIFNSLWSRNIVRVSLVILNQSEKTALLISSSPYSTLYKTCKEIVSFTQLQVMNIVNNETQEIEIAGYQFEPPNSFLGCPLVGYTFPFPPYSIADTNSSSGCRVYNSGIEVQLVKLLGNVYNFSLEIVTTPNYGTSKEWWQEFPNGTKKGMLENIMQNEIDLAFAGVVPPSVFYYRLSVTNTYIDSSISWYVPGAELVPMWDLVVNTFSGVTWLFMFFVFFLVTLLSYFISGFENNNEEEQLDLTMVALSLGLSIQWTKRSHLRILLLAWSLFCFHIVLMFNTRLFSVLTEHPYDSDIETIQHLLDSKFKPCTYGSYKNFYINRTDGIMRKLVENARICDSLDESVKLLLKHKNFSILAKDDYMALKIDNKLENIHRLKYNKFINYPVVMPVAKGSVFLEVFNKLIFNVSESGLVFKWLSDIRRKFKYKLSPKETQDSSAENYLMTKEDFVWLYYLFLGGQAIAIIVFLVEMCIKPISR